jgi:predicted nuclease of predicted toxin-antitoxin system
LIYGCPPKIIWLKTGNLNTSEITTLLIKHQQTISQFIGDEKFKDLACLEI